MPILAKPRPKKTVTYKLQTIPGSSASIGEWIGLWWYRFKTRQEEFFDEGAVSFALMSKGAKTYPRTIIFDKKDPFMQVEEDPNDDGYSSSKMQIHSDGWKRHSFTKFYQKSMQYLDFSESSSSSPNNANAFQAGQEIPIDEDVAESIRYIVEDCDNFDGFTVMSDSVGVWGGYTHKAMEYFVDYFGVKNIQKFGLLSPYNNHDMTKVDPLGVALNLWSLSLTSSFFAPMLLPPFETSMASTLAEIGCMMETFTSPFFLQSDANISNVRLSGLYNIYFGTSTNATNGNSNTDRKGSQPLPGPVHCLSVSGAGVPTSLDAFQIIRSNIHQEISKDVEWQYYYPVPVYLADATDACLNAVSSRLILDNSFSQNPIRNYVKDLLKVLLSNNRHAHGRILQDMDIEFDAIIDTLEKI